MCYGVRNSIAKIVIIQCLRVSTACASRSQNSRGQSNIKNEKTRLGASRSQNSQVGHDNGIWQWNMRRKLGDESTFLVPSRPWHGRGARDFFICGIGYWHHHWERLRYVIWPTWKESKFTRRIELICNMDSPLNRRFARAGVGLHLSSMKWNIQNSIRKGKQDKGVQKNWIDLNLQIS